MALRDLAEVVFVIFGRTSQRVFGRLPGFDLWLDNLTRLSRLREPGEHERVQVVVYSHGGELLGEQSYSTRAEALEAVSGVFRKAGWSTIRFEQESAEGFSGFPCASQWRRPLDLGKRGAVRVAIVPYDPPEIPTEC